MWAPPSSAALARMSSGDPGQIREQIRQYSSLINKLSILDPAQGAKGAGIALRDAVKAQVAASGVNSVTRATIFDQLRKIHDFSADGFFVPIDLAGKTLRPCGVINQVKNGKIVRVRPTKPGTFTCSKNGRYLWKLDLIKS